MADKTLSIKNATDAELTDILYRLRAEQDALRMLRELKVLSTPNPKGKYASYSNLEGFSTETPVSNGKSIKQMTNEELSNFLDRLRNETEVTRIIQEIQDLNKPRNYEGRGMVDQVESYPGIDLNAPVDSLYHIGTWKSGRYPRGSGKNPSKNDLLISKKTYETGAATAKEYGNIAGLMRSRKEDRYSNEMRRRAKDISDDDLKRIVNRLNMEQQYRNLTTKDVNVGRSRLEDTLTVVGSMMTIAAAGAGLALTVKQLKEKTDK